MPRKCEIASSGGADSVEFPDADGFYDKERETAEPGTSRSTFPLYVNLDIRPFGRATSESNGNQREKAAAVFYSIPVCQTSISLYSDRVGRYNRLSINV